MARLSPIFQWALIATALLSGLAILWPQNSTPTIVSAASDDSSRARHVAANNSSADAVPRNALPETLPRLQLDAARFDPFVGVKPPVQAAPPVVTQPVVAAPLSPPPQAPALNYRYLGRMTDPVGQSYIYLTRGDAAAAVAVRSGDRLEDGYVVESINQDGIRLLYPALDLRAVIPIPVDAEPGRR